MSDPVVYRYYATWDAGMSTFGAFNTVMGILVGLIVGFNPFVYVALVNSTAAALAYGFSWGAYSGKYQYQPSVKVPMSVIADFCWLVQEAGLSFYSFLIVRTLLRGRERTVYLIVFWFLEFSIVACRVPIMVYRVLIAKVAGPIPKRLDDLVAYYHMGYFISIALCESWNAYFLLKTFYKAKTYRTVAKATSSPSNNNSIKRRTSNVGYFSHNNGFYSQLLTSSEVRLAALASIGMIRAVVFTIRDGRHASFEVDTATASVETFFSTVFLLDILATRLAKVKQQLAGMNNSRRPTVPQAVPGSPVSSMKPAAKNYPLLIGESILTPTCTESETYIISHDETRKHSSDLEK